MTVELRRLAICEGCKRQWDASGHDGGSRFRCTCGELVEVPDPRPGEAAVVRCSSCGGARAKGDKTCAHCGADFTLHERDLHTICPHCTARISDRSRFCHACGKAIAPQQRIGAMAREKCPACQGERPLHTRSLESEEVVVLECDRCAGMWVGHQFFDLLQRRARGEMVSWSNADKARQGEPRPREQEGRYYRQCVVCDKLMHRHNYGKKSGVIVDVCHDHGLWFDDGELEQIIDWVRSGGPEQVERLKAVEPKAPAKRLPPVGSVGDVLTSRPASVGSGGSLVTLLIEALIEFLTRGGTRR